MTNLGCTFFIYCDTSDGKRDSIRTDDHGNTFRSYVDAEKYAQEKNLKNPQIVDSSTFMKAAQANIAARYR